MLPPPHGNIQCRLHQPEEHPLSLVRQLHQVIHLHDQIPFRNAVHHLDLELVGPHHQLLPLPAIIDLRGLASLDEKTSL